MARKPGLSLFEATRMNSNRGYPYKKPEIATPAKDQTPRPADDSRNVQFSRSMVFLVSMVVVTLVSGAFLLGQRTASRSDDPNPMMVEVQPDVAKIEPRVDVAIKPAAPNVASTPAMKTVQGRLVGLNYCIIQSYPAAEKKMAEEAIATLKANGVEATLETRPKRYANIPGWVSVISLQGFESQSSSDAQNFKKKVESISQKNMKAKSFKAFTPDFYKWGEVN
jgi:hypothetical protein